MYSRRSPMSSVSASRFENPTMAFRGVRISWLMLARKADLSLSLTSALFLASIRFFSVCFSSVTSKLTHTISIFDGSVFSGLRTTLTRVHPVGSPLGVTRRSSVNPLDSPALTRLISRNMASRSSGST